MTRIFEWMTQKLKKKPLNYDENKVMSLHPEELTLVTAPHPILEKACLKFDTLDDWTYNRLVADRLLQIMLGFDGGVVSRYLGVGMAAPQVGVHRRFFVMTPLKKNREKDIWFCFSPKITRSGNQIAEENEGCLSYPGRFEPVPRYRVIDVMYFDENKKLVEKTLKGWPARVFQHELDHLNGVICVKKKKVRIPLSVKK